jgi:hypothetical protein
LLLYSSHLPLGVPNGLVIHHASSLFSGAIAGEEWKTSVRGVFARTSFTLLLFCFTLFILPASFYIKNPKKLESLVAVFTCLLSFC